MGKVRDGRVLRDKSDRGLLNRMINSVSLRFKLRTFRPAGRDVGEHEGMHEAAASRRAAKGDEVSLKPGAGSSHSADIRMGMLSSRACATGRRRGQSQSLSRIGPSVLSIVPRSSGANLDLERG